MWSESEKVIPIAENTPILRSNEPIWKSELRDRIEKSGGIERYNTDVAKLAQNPWEETAFDDKYINGFWQEVTLKDGTKMSFAELLKIGQEDPKKEVTILAQLPDEWESWIQYVENSMTETGGESDWYKYSMKETGGEYEKKEQLIIFQGKIKSDLASANQLLWDKFPKISDNEKQSLAQQIPQLQGTSPETLKNGKYDDIISAYYLVQNESKIASSLSNPADKVKFLAITNSLDKTFGGIEKKVEIFGKRVDTMVLGHGINPEDVKTQWGKWIREGYSNVSFNNQTREFTFQNEKTGITKKINLRRQIAQESIVKNGLSISRNLIPASTEENSFEKKYTNYQEDTGKIVQESEHSPRTPELDSLNSIDKASMDNDFKEWKAAEIVWDIPNALSSTEKWLIKKLALIENLIQMKEESGEWNSADSTALKNKKEQTQVRLGTIETSMNQYILLRQEEQKIKWGKPREGFDTNAEVTLNKLSEFGLNKLWQAGVEGFMEAWNYKNKDQKEFQIYFQDGKLEPQQENALRIFIHKRFGESEESRNGKFQELKENLTNINFITNKWSTPEKRSQYLFETPKSETP